MIIAVYFGGGGAGILVSSAVLPPLLGLGAGGWRLGWLALAAAALVGLAFAAIAVPKVAAGPAPPPASDGSAVGPSLAPTYAAYVCFGAGYVGYITFIIALLRQGAVPATTIAVFWAMLGLASVATSFVWGAVFDRLGPGRPLLVVLLMEAAGATLPLVWSAWPSLFASAWLFGGALMAAPGAVAVAVRNARPAAAWTVSVGRMTIAFGIGQCAGPLASGYLADTAAGIATGLAASAVLLVAGAAISFFQR
jgi:predicted MFS family arabinose efflux permease